MIKSRVDSPDSCFSSNDGSAVKKSTNSRYNSEKSNKKYVHYRQGSYPMLSQREIDKREFNSRIYPLDYHKKSALLTPEDGVIVINRTTSQPFSTKPIHERLFDIAKQKQTSSSPQQGTFKDKKFAEALAAMQYPFKPQISLRSSQIAEQLRARSITP